MPRATGASRRHSGLSAPAATKKSAAATATKPQPKPRESIPAGNWRIFVRGLRPSIRGGRVVGIFAVAVQLTELIEVGDAPQRSVGHHAHLAGLVVVLGRG